MSVRDDEPVVKWMRVQAWKIYGQAIAIGLLAIAVVGLFAVGLAVIA